MRICFVTLDYYPHRSSGLDVYGETLVHGLVAMGHDVHVVARQTEATPASQEILGATVHRVAGGRLDWITYARHAVSLVRSLERTHPFDLLHYADVHFAYPCRQPYIATLHQSFRQRLQARGFMPAYSDVANLATRLVYYTTARHLAEKPAVIRARQLIAVSRTTARAFVDEYHLDPAIVAVIRNGIDTTRFAPTASDLRARLGLEEAQVLLFVGFCTPRKGLEYLAAALGNLPESVHLVVVGRWQERYKRRILSALGAAAPRFHAVGYVPDEALPAYYSMADLFVSPSLLEGFGLPLAEALACGTPVITTSAGACPEVVGPGGLVVPPMNTAALAQAISSLLRQPDRRQNLSQLGRAWACRELCAHNMIEGHLQLYEQTLATR